jgi:hypothetical protein
MKHLIAIFFALATIAAAQNTFVGVDAGNALVGPTPAQLRTAAGLVIGTHVLAPNGSAAALTGFPTLNQNTTGSAATLTTPRAINGVNFDGSAAITITAAAGTLTGTALNSAITTASGLTTVAGGTFGSNAFNSTAFLSANQTITISGDATGSGATAITLNVAKINGVALSGLATGILKNTTATGVPTIAVAGTDYLAPNGSAAALTGFPTLNQNTTGSAATLTTPRAIHRCRVRDRGRGDAHQFHADHGRRARDHPGAHVRGAEDQYLFSEPARIDNQHRRGEQREQRRLRAAHSRPLL